MSDVLTAPDETLTREQHAAGLRAYQEAGVKREQAIGNRGPVRFGPDGTLHQDILDAYWEHGYYIFEGVVGADEIEELRRDAHEMLERAPVSRDAKVDRHGRPALGIDYPRLPYRFVKPLGDPWGGTDVFGGRHPHRMDQPKPAADAPEQVVFTMNSICQSMPAGLRIYGHPQLLAIAASVNGQDFVPFNDSVFVKQPGVGGSVAWHQDGVTHWDSPDWDRGSHGFNFQVQLYPTTAANALWVVPGTHAQGRVDIKALVAENGGSEQIPGAVPLVCKAGDVTIVNRQTLHGSFANSSPDIRMSITFGFHRRRAVLGAPAALVVAEEAEDLRYDETRIFRRASVIQVAIDARRQHYPDETPFAYEPFAGREDEFRFNERTFETVIKNYFMNDLSI